MKIVYPNGKQQELILDVTPGERPALNTHPHTVIFGMPGTPQTKVVLALGPVEDIPKPPPVEPPAEPPASSVLPFSGAQVGELDIEFDFTKPLDPKYWVKQLDPSGMNGIKTRPEDVHQHDGQIDMVLSSPTMGGAITTNPRLVRDAGGQGYEDPGYCYIEFFAKIERGQWGAVWRVPPEREVAAKGWEADVAEPMGNRLYANCHIWGGGQHLYDGTQQTPPAGDWLGNWHYFAVNLRKDHISWWWDKQNVRTHHITDPAQVINTRGYLMANTGNGLGNELRIGAMTSVKRIRIWR